MKKTNPPISVRAGKLEFLKLNAARWDKRDTYYWLLTLTWPRFALFLSGAYVGVNLLFALLFTLGGSEAIAEMRGGSFVDAFFFSVETLATIGYGHMYPVSFYGHLVVTAEVIVGMFGMAVVTGLIFVRFSRPTASLEFTRTIRGHFRVRRSPGADGAGRQPAAPTDGGGAVSDHDAPQRTVKEGEYVARVSTSCPCRWSGSSCFRRR